MRDFRIALMKTLNPYEIVEVIRLRQSRNTAVESNRKQIDW